MEYQLVPNVYVHRTIKRHIDGLPYVIVDTAQGRWDADEMVELGWERVYVESSSAGP